MSVFIGLQAQEFTSPALMPDGEINFEFSLYDYKQNKKCVVFFYSMDFSQVDPTEIIALNQAFKAFEERDTKVVAVSTDSFMSHKMWQKIPVGKGGVGKINFPLVSDYTKKVAQGYDVIMNDTFAMRATFVLDSNGYIRHQSINDFPIGRNIEEIIRIVDAIDFNIETNNLCPANWKKGKKGISTDDEFAREFLKA